MHPDYPMETRVIVDESVHPSKPLGTIIGIASMHIIFCYIVLLDSPVMVQGETYRAISVPGILLKPLPMNLEPN